MTNSTTSTSSANLTVTLSDYLKVILNNIKKDKI